MKNRPRWIKRGEKLRLRKELFARQAGICYLCGAPMIYQLDRCAPHHNALATFDHLTALADGGASDRSNLKLAHHGCNSLRDRSNIVGVPMVRV